MNYYYVISSGSYSDYGISYIVQSEREISNEQFREYYLESIRRSSEFDDKQLAKLRKFLNRDDLKSTNYYTVFWDNQKVEVSFENWQQFCKEAGVEDNPYTWLEQVLTENGIKSLAYEEYNTDDWD